MDYITLDGQVLRMTRRNLLRYLRTVAAGTLDACPTDYGAVPLYVPINVNDISADWAKVLYDRYSERDT